MIGHTIFNFSALKISINCCLFCVSIITQTAIAESLTFTATYSDIFTQLESEEQIRIIAQTRARRMVFKSAERTIQSANIYKEFLPVKNLLSACALGVMTFETKFQSLKKTSNGHSIRLELVGSLDTGTLETNLENFSKNRFLFENALSNRELELTQLETLDVLKEKFKSVQKPTRQPNLGSERELIVSKRQRAVRRLAAIALNDTIIAATVRKSFLDPGEIIKRMNQAIALDDRNEWLYLHRGKVFSRFGDRIFASADFERAVLLNPYLVFPYEFLGDLHYNAGEDEKAIQFFSQAIALDTQYEPTLLKRGRAFREIGQYKWAVRDFIRVIGIDPKNPVGYLERGDTHYASGKYVEAAADYEKVIALNPMDGEVYEKRGRARMAMGLFDEACDDLRKACEMGLCNGLYTTTTAGDCLSRNPSAADEWSRICYEHIVKGMWDEAIKAAVLAIYYNPDMLSSYINRAWAYAETGSFEKALKDCKRALEMDPENAMANNNCGLVFEKKGDLSMAGKKYLKACELGLEIGCKNYLAVEKQPRPEESRVDRLLRQSTEKYDKKDWDAVIHLTSLAIQRDPENYQAYTNRAAAFFRKKRFKEAMTDCSKAIRINPSLGLAYNIRGYTLEHVGKPEEAMVDYYVGCMLNFKLACQNHDRLEYTVYKK